MALGNFGGGRLTCAYHGLAFDIGGRCVASPTSSREMNCSLRRYPVREVGPLIWIEFGDEAAADASPLPPQQTIGLGEQGWLMQCVGYNNLKARYTLLIDNLFDLSRLAFIHASLVGEYGLAFAEPKIEEIDGRLTVSRILRDVPADRQNRFLFPQTGQRMTTRLASEAISVGLINAGGPTFDGPDEHAPRLRQQNFVHGFTPETAGSTHYWLMMTRDFRQQDDALSAQLAGSMRAGVAQDVEALEAIEQALASGSMLPREMSMMSDAGCSSVTPAMSESPDHRIGKATSAHPIRVLKWPIAALEW